jgi:hypothetical protein
MGSYQTFASGQGMTLAECLNIVETAKSELPGYREVFQKFNNSAEFILRSDWEALLDAPGIDFAGLLSCSAKIPKKLALHSVIQRMLNLAHVALAGKSFSVTEEFRLNSVQRGTQNEEIQIKLDAGKVMFAYTTYADGINKIERIFNAVIVAAEVPIRFEQRGENYYLVPLRSDLAFRTNYSTSTDGANARKFICEMPCENIGDLLPKVAGIVEMLGDGSPSKGSWFYMPTGDPNDRTPWREELEFFATNDFPFSEVDICTCYSINDLKVLGALEKLGVKNSWFKTSVAIFEFPGSEPCELFVKTTPKGHQIMVALADNKLTGRIQDVLKFEFRRDSKWD